MLKRQRGSEHGDVDIDAAATVEQSASGGGGAGLDRTGGARADGEVREASGALLLVAAVAQLGVSAFSLRGGEETNERRR